MSIYSTRRAHIEREFNELLHKHNQPVLPGNGIFTRYENPILTAGHVPPAWRYDYDAKTNPRFMERLGINGVFNAGAICYQGRYYVVARVEGWDRKSFFALAESPDGIHDFRFMGEPLLLGDVADP